MMKFYVWDDAMANENEADTYVAVDTEHAVILYLEKNFANLYEHDISETEVNVRLISGGNILRFGVDVRAEPVFSAWEKSK